MKRINFLLLVFSLLTIGLLSESCKKDEVCPEINCNTGTLNEETCACNCPNGFSGTNCETEDLCITSPIACQNGGTPNVDCTECDCPTGTLGTNCEDFDATQIQALLNGGKTPKELFDGGIILDSLYGKMYEGGIIFYLNTVDGTGMVAATEDQSVAEWGCFGVDIMGLNNVTECPGMGNCQQPLPEDTFEGAQIGDGAANTDAILAECMTDGIAAKLCRDLGEGWFLPSRGELNLMYTNLNAKGHGGFAAVFYWSSTEFVVNSAWLHDFSYGFQDHDGKVKTYRVRAARAF